MIKHTTSNKPFHRYQFYNSNSAVPGNRIIIFYFTLLRRNLLISFFIRSILIGYIVLCPRPTLGIAQFLSFALRSCELISTFLSLRKFELKFSISLKGQERTLVSTLNVFETGILVLAELILMLIQNKGKNHELALKITFVDNFI